jgi:hypothetical protein
MAFAVKSIVAEVLRNNASLIASAAAGSHSACRTDQNTRRQPTYSIRQSVLFFERI